jgi:hypothetical protein
MKKMFMMILILFVVSFPFSTNVSASDSIYEELSDSNSIYEELEIGEDYIKALEESDSTGFIIEEEIILDKIDLQLEKLEQDIEKLSTLNGPEQNIYEHLKDIDFHEIIEDEVQILEEQLESKRDLIDTIEESEVETSEESNEESEVETSEESSELTIDDLEYFSSISDKYETTELLDVEVSVYIVELDSESDELDVYELSDYVEQIDRTESSTALFFDKLFGLQKAHASNRGLGVFTVVHSHFVGNPNTKKADFVQAVKVTKESGNLKPKHYTVTFNNRTKTTSSGNWTHNKRTYTNVKKNKEVTHITRISSTRFRQATVEVKAHYTGGETKKVSKSNTTYLYNKKGVRYPSYVDPVSKKVMTVPSSALWSKVPKSDRVKWGNTQRKKYRNWYDSTYKPLKWSEYDIHHIRPKIYGGSNNNSNLIPLKKSYHRGIVTPWWSAY